METKKHVRGKSIPVGTRFGHLIVVGESSPMVIGKYNKHFNTSECKCDCGNTVVEPNNRLLSGRVKSCGCLRYVKRGPRLPYINTGGYRMVYCEGHPRAEKNGYVREHILVMERFIGRFLKSDEVVHHKDGNKINNSIDNLLLLTKSEHAMLHGKMRKKEVKRCLKCGNPISKRNTYCRKCIAETFLIMRLKRLANEVNTTVEEYLTSLLNDNYLEDVARKLKITSNSIRYWIRKLGIKYTKKKRIGNIAVVQTPQAIAKAREKLKEYYKTHQSPLSKKVAQFTKSGELVKRYECIDDVEKDGFSRDCVSRCMRNIRKSHHGFLWKPIE